MDLYGYDDNSTELRSLKELTIRAGSEELRKVVKFLRIQRAVVRIVMAELSRVKLLFLLSLMILVACERQLSPEASLMDLVVNGNRYDGSEVIVSGYYHSGHKSSAIYFSKDQSDYGLIKDAIWIDLGEGVIWQNFSDDGLDDDGRFHSLSGKYITVEGVFSMRESNRIGEYGGSMVASRIFITRKRSE